MDEKVTKILKRLTEIEEDRAGVLAEIKAYNEIYFMEYDMKTPSGWDKNDLRKMVSPTGRNKVKGISDLVASTDPIFTVEAERHDDLLKETCSKMLTASNRRRRTSVEKDLALSAALYAEIHLVIKDVSVLLDGLDDGIQKSRLERLLKKTPFLFDTVNPEFAYPSFGVDGELDMWFEKYESKGWKIKDKWEADGDATNLDDDVDYEVWDGFTLTHRLVAVVGQESSHQILFEEHGLKEFPVVVRHVSGSDLFVEEERKRNPLLYAYHKGEMFKSESIYLTAMTTSTLASGVGPMLLGEPDDSGEGMEIKVDNQGPIRLMYPVHGKATNAKMPAFDKEVMELYGMVRNMADESTMHSQALGAPMQGKSTYSTVALLSQSGRLPLAAIQDAVEKSLAAIMEIALRRIKDENPSEDVLGADKVPDDFEVTAKLDVKLSQDAVKEATLMQQLSGQLSQEFLMENILHIPDAKAEKYKVIKEAARDEMVKAMLPQSIERMMGQIAQMQGASTGSATGQGGQGQQMGQGMQGQPSPEQMAMMQQQQGQGMQGQGTSTGSVSGQGIPPEIMEQLRAMLPPEQVAQIEQAFANGQMTPEQLMQLVQQMAGGGQPPAGGQTMPVNPQAGIEGGMLPQTEPTNLDQIG